MKSPELVILCINAAFLFIAYFCVYPILCGADGKKIAQYDALITAVVLVIAYVLYADKSIEFNALIMDLNWFWFTLLTYLALELPLTFWYYNKHNVWKSLT